MSSNSQKVDVASRVQVDIDICLKTYNAQHYIWGNSKDVLGLFKFARIVIQIHTASKKDDPYADWFLRRIHDEIKQTRSRLQRLEKEYQEAFKKRSNHQRIILFKDPAIIKARFASAYSNMAADMLGDYDRVLVLVLSAKATGLALDKPYNDIHQSLNAQVRNVLNLPRQWKTTHVTREDIKQNTDRAKQALALMGQLPSKILRAEIKAQYANESNKRNKRRL